ncbi:MAG: hypothetical protein RJA57_1115 [Bacteroidota bacterium]|jgi:ABC-2 type transport system permease protein
MHEMDIFAPSMHPKPPPYSQRKALWAITRASFKAIFANPSAIIFSILFPIIFVLIFGAFGNGNGTVYRVAVTDDSDTTHPFYLALHANPAIRLVRYLDSTALNKDLVKGRLTAVLGIYNISDSAARFSCRVAIRSTSASANTFAGFFQILDYTRLQFESAANGTSRPMVTLQDPEIRSVRKYRPIDFILPGQLGFSILFSTLFGIAFTFYNLREQLVLKRFYASPVNRTSILFGIGVSRLFFQLLSVVVLLLFGHFVLQFTLQYGWITFTEILIMTLLMLFFLMGVGLIFSSIVRTDTAIPLLINLFGFPQMMLSGTFFPIDVFPKWLQEICQLLPLTQYNDAIRKISFEGMHLTDSIRELGILGAWMALAYIVLVRVLRWE